MLAYGGPDSFLKTLSGLRRLRVAFAYPLHLNDRLTPIGGLIYNDVRRRIVIIHDEVHL